MEIYNERLLRTKELSQFLSVDPSTIWRWKNSKTINFPNAIALGPNSVAWRLSDINKWIEANKNGN
jgi:predicted DNA-binding transcriptional regulator AlpA